jgi:hypothetical protein
MVVHSYNPSTWKAEGGGHELEASLDYKARPCSPTPNFFKQKIRELSSLSH